MQSKNKEGNQEDKFDRKEYEQQFNVEDSLNELK